MTRNNVVQLHRRKPPRVFTKQEQFIDSLREAILTSGLTYTILATRAGVSITTIQRLASGYTRWPRHTTLFPLLQAVGKRLAFVDA